MITTLGLVIFCDGCDFMFVDIIALICLHYITVCAAVGESQSHVILGWHLSFFLSANSNRFCSGLLDFHRRYTIHVTADILSTVCAAFSPASSSKYHREQHASSALLFTFLFLLKTFLENRSSAVKWFLYNKWLTEMKYFNRCCNF